MAQLLGDEYPAFRASYDQPAHLGLRVNTLKLSPADFNSKSPFTLKPAGPHAPAGFLVQDASKPGSHPYHTAGLYYLQEPSAMAVAQLVDPQPGDWVLDLAAAPGGKSTHLAALMADQGLLVANDIDAKRARILAENLERWGVRNALITTAHPEHLAQCWGARFDRVLLDAPCSGEGMFRRLGAFEWSEAYVQTCARRQTAVLHSAAQLVKPGGRLVYTTCTFSPEEDEQTIAQFLHSHPHFALINPPHHPGFSPGRPDWSNGEPTLARTIRLWPHHFPGEGHFIAILQNQQDAIPPETKKPARVPQPDRSALQLWRSFARDHLIVDWADAPMELVNGRYLHRRPDHLPDTSGLHLIRAGLQLGEISKKHFRPAHALALHLPAAHIVHSHNFPATAPEITAYLNGQALTASPGDGTPGDGPAAPWAAITVDGYPLGWVKQAGSRWQNHYPKGLRQ
jgi:16S rRNA C967 or C1407 C5-methylase (RsmB/RsmF family)/NOL1/NOP2/fmu family ribosome biogenesis protein